MKFSTKIQAKLYLKWINFWYPLKFKWNGQHLIKNKSFISKNFLSCGKYDDDNKWTVFKQFWTQEMLDDLKNIKPFNIDEYYFDEYFINEDRKDKLENILNDKPFPPTLQRTIEEGIKDNIKKYQDGRKTS